MMTSVATALHILAAVIWIGGMFFAYVCLRPTLGGVEAEQRLTLWAGVFRKFFPWVWMSVVILFFSGFYLIAQYGGFSGAGKYILTMMTIAIVMTAIFKFLYIAPYRHLKLGIQEQDFKKAAFALGTIRKLIATNLVLGIAVVVIATGFKAWH